MQTIIYVYIIVNFILFDKYCIIIFEFGNATSCAFECKSDYDTINVLYRFFLPKNNLRMVFYA